MMISESGLHKRSFQFKESQCTMLSDIPEALDAATSSIKHRRDELERYIAVNPDYRLTLQPCEVDDGPDLIKLMAGASERAGVGPMAAVAGVLADLAVEEMLKVGARVAVVEDGGEASVASDRPIDVALQAGDTLLSRRVGFRLERFPIGVATSSGVFSHALSFGEAEAVTVFAENAGVADAAATAVCNVVKGGAKRDVVEGAVDLGLAIEGVEGVFILYGGLVGMGGDVPQVISVRPDEKEIALVVR